MEGALDDEVWRVTDLATGGAIPRPVVCLHVVSAVVVPGAQIALSRTLFPGAQVVLEDGAIWAFCRHAVFVDDFRTDY